LRAMSATPAVRYERRGAIGEIVLDRPDNRNSMTPELLDAFAAASAEARADAEARCVIVRGEGSCFSAGADFKSTLQLEGGLPSDRSYAMYRPFLSVLDIEVPVIGALNGHAVGGGFGLALVTDIRIANRDAKYGANFTRVGLHSGMAISYLLPRLVGVSRANELLFTGRLVRGHEAEAMGLVSKAVEAEQVLPEARAMAEAIAGNAPLVIRTTKAAIRAGLGWDPKAAARREAPIQAESLQTEDAKEGMKALLEKRDPVFRGK
ncbi:MAG TPA: enoyl-CoA hydratase/isomerase family protein, partial [Polyangiaceae bacterium LLY-WYZ-15_(1-7)]|nr:enoyl-CoA hydratase/isomerase family protein [Polyangiaceae bacterium LLY-WYZ-15_(1-7)]